MKTKLLFFFIILISSFRTFAQDTLYYDYNGKQVIALPYTTYRVFYFDKNKISNGLVREFFKDGTLKWESYVSSVNPLKFDKLYKEFSKDGILLKEIEYKNGVNNGSEILYNKKGYILYNTHYKKGILHGTKITYNQSEQNYITKTEEYQNGFLKGKVVTYYSNHSIKTEAHYVNDTLQGTLKKYNLNGDLYYEVTYEKGKRNRSEKFYRNGSCYEENIYDLDTLKSKKTYYTSGKIKSEKVYNSLSYTIATITEFYESGRIKSYQEFKGHDTFKLIKSNEDGMVIGHVVPDSLIVQPVKISSTCLYGFKRNNEWVIEPQFYDYTRVNGNYYIVKEGAKVGVVNYDGKQIIPAMYDKVELLKSQNYTSEQNFVYTINYFIVTNDGKKGIISSENVIIIPLKYTNIIENGNFTLRLSVGDTLYGLADYNHVIIEPEYSGISKYLSGTFIVQRAGKMGIIDDNGGILLPIEYDKVFRDQNIGGNYWIKKNNKFGICNSHGTIILPIEYTSKNPMYNKYFVVMLQKDGHYGIINSEGNVLIPFEYDSIRFIYNEIDDRCNTKLLCLIKKDSLWGWCDKDGKESLVPKYENIRCVTSDRYLYTKNNGYDLYFIVESQNQFGLVTDIDSVLIPIKYDAEYSSKGNTYGNRLKNSTLVFRNDSILRIFSYDRLKEIYPYEYYDFDDWYCNFCINGKGYKCGVVEKYGKIILAPEYSYMGDASNFLIYENEKERFYIDKKSGEKFNVTGDFDIQDGIYYDDYSAYLVATKNNKIGIYDFEKDSFLLDTIYMAIYYPDTDGNEIIWVKKNIDFDNDSNDSPLYYNWGLLTVKGDTILPEEYDYPIDFVTDDGYLNVVMKNNLYGIVDNTGKVIQECKYEEIEGLQNGNFLVKTENGLWGILQPDGKDLIVPQWDDLYGFYNEYALFWKKDSLGIITVKGKIIEACSNDNINFLIKQYFESENLYDLLGASDSTIFFIEKNFNNTVKQKLYNLLFLSNIKYSTRESNEYYTNRPYSGKKILFDNNLSEEYLLDYDEYSSGSEYTQDVYIDSYDSISLILNFYNTESYSASRGMGYYHEYTSIKNYEIKGNEIVEYTIGDIFKHNSNYYSVVNDIMVKTIDSLEIQLPNCDNMLKLFELYGENFYLTNEGVVIFINLEQEEYNEPIYVDILIPYNKIYKYLNLNSVVGRYIK